jgi:hypothetical protein
VLAAQPLGEGLEEVGPAFDLDQQSGTGVSHEATQFQAVREAVHEGSKADSLDRPTKRDPMSAPIHLQSWDLSSFEQDAYALVTGGSRGR